MVIKKEVFFLFVLFFLASAGVLAQNLPQISDELTENVKDYVSDFVNGTGVNEEVIDSITPIDQNELPDNVEIKDIDENKVGIYEVNYSENNEIKKVYVVTYSTPQLKEKTNIVKNIQNLYFGYAGTSTSSDYLEASGVRSSENNGYVMIREGSITGISTSLDLSGTGKVYISVYKNGEDTGFHNLITAQDGKKIDYDIQSENAVSYSPGDVIAVRVQASGNINWGNAVTTVETTSG